MHLLAFFESIQLFPDGTIFIHIALILLMIWVLNRTFFRPVNQIIESREKHKNVEGGEAGSILSQAAEKEARYEREMLDARSRGYALIESEHKKLARARERKLGEIKAEIAQTVAAEKSEIEKQAAEARATLETDARKLADEIAETILKA